MRRVRKPKGQLSFPKRDRNGQLRGGKRPGAGRKAKGERASAPHRRRKMVDARHPQHVTLRVGPQVKWLRTPKAYRAIRGALVAVSAHAKWFRIVHFSLQGDHLHLLCEARDATALARGVQGFAISAARRLNRELGRERGQVFPDRYHVEPIDSVRQVRHALSYVLNNWRKHKQAGVGLFDGRIDPYSSGVWFEGWKERTAAVAVPHGYEAPMVSEPATWLLSSGYKLAPPISAWAVPGQRRR